MLRNKSNKMKKWRNLFKRTLFENDTTYWFFYKRLKQIAISIFDWDGLPRGCNMRFLENTLFDEGIACMVFDPDLDLYFTLKVAATGHYDVYGEPDTFEGIGVGSNYYRMAANSETGVILYDSLLHEPMAQNISYWAMQLWNVNRAIHINLNTQKTPVMIGATEETKLTMLNAWEEYDGGQPVIFTLDGFNPENFTVLDLKAEFKGLQLYELQDKIWNDALTYIGLPNLAYEKKERMNQQEVESGNGAAFASRYNRQEAREIAAHKMKDIWGIDVTPRYRLFSDSEVLQWRSMLRSASDVSRETLEGGVGLG